MLNEFISSVQYSTVHEGHEGQEGSTHERIRMIPFTNY